MSHGKPSQTIEEGFNKFVIKIEKSLKKIAQLFHVTPGAINDIKRGKNWKEVVL